MSCSTASPVAAGTVDHMLTFMPSRGLIQHEWQEHGTCSGLSAQEYFAKAEQAFRNLHVPEQYQKANHQQQLNVSDLEKSFADANHAPPEGFRVSCHAGELVSLEVCVDKAGALAPFPDRGMLRTAGAGGATASDCLKTGCGASVPL